jgi:hypothetical protein
VRIGIDTAMPNQVLKIPPCDMKDPSGIYEARAVNAVCLGGTDLSRRQRVGDQELSDREPQQQLSGLNVFYPARARPIVIPATTASPLRRDDD